MMQEVEKIENTLRKDYGVEIVERQYNPTSCFKLIFSEEQWCPLSVFFNSSKMRHFLDNCIIKSFMLSRAKHGGGVGDVPQVSLISSYCIQFNGTLSMLEFFIALLSRKGMSTE